MSEGRLETLPGVGARGRASLGADWSLLSLDVGRSLNDLSDINRALSDGRALCGRASDAWERGARSVLRGEEARRRSMYAGQWFFL